MERFIIRWQELGASIGLANFRSQRGKIKIIGESRRIEKNDPPDPSWDEYNFLYIDLAKSGLCCFDIENIGNSVKVFKDRLSSAGKSLDSFFYERSMNGGVHIYFRSEGISGKKNYGSLRSGEIVFDALNKGRAFTSPSYFGDKRYEWGPINPFTIKSLDEIGKVPDWMNDIILID